MSDINDLVKEFKRIPASKISKNPRNWRRHPDEQREAFRGMVDKVGFAGACLVRHLGRGKYELIDGELRLDEVGGDMSGGVPCLVIDVDEAGADALLASVDPISAMAGSDLDALEELMSSVDLSDIEPLESYLDDLASSLRDDDPDVEIVEDEVPEVPDDPITKVGDVWSLGRHRLVCGDCTDRSVVSDLMGGESAGMVLTDPPYGVGYVGKTTDAMTIENDDLDEDSLSTLVTGAFDCAEESCSPGAYWYATVPARPLHLVFAEDWKRRGILRQIMVWVKDSMVLGHSEYHYRHEPILFGWIKGDRKKNSDRTRTTVWEYSRPKASREHPTTKPISLWCAMMNDGSVSGGTVYDPFLGSGTTLIAAEQLDRTCYGCEISPAYCDVIVTRWENLTGEKAKRISG